MASLQLYDRHITRLRPGNPKGKKRRRSDTVTWITLNAQDENTIESRLAECADDGRIETCQRVPLTQGIADGEQVRQWL
jgi:hypothetical protein